MRFSVVTPSFNQVEFLGRCLASVARQSLQPVEHLVFDPGSSDGSREIAAAAEGVTLIAEADQGQGDAVAKGMLRATGDVIAWVNSDDEYADGSVFAAVAEAFASAEQPDIVYGRGIYVGRNEEYLRAAHVIAKPDEFDWRLSKEVGILQPATFIAKKLIDRIGPVSKDYHFCMDYEFWIRARQAGAKFQFLDRVLARARYYDSNKTMGQRESSLREVISMVKAKFGFAHIDWIRRLADCRLHGHDGILKNFGNQTVDAAQLDKLTDQLNAQINGDFDTHAAIRKRGVVQGTRLTLEALDRSVASLPAAYAQPIPLETQTAPGAQCYTVGERRWAFKRSWLEPQISETTRLFERLAAERRSKTCIIAGNGPSLNRTDFGHLAGQDVFITNYSIINRQLRDVAKYLCVTNYLVAEQGAHEFNTLERIEKILPYWLSYCILPSPLTHYVKSIGYDRFSTDFRDNISWRSTVSFFAMQVAYALGYEKVLLVGFDHSYQQPKDIKEGVVIQQDQDDQNHFDPRYFKGRQWQAADTANMEAMYALSKAAFEADGREIVNCTVGGKLELFRRGDLAQELGLSPAPVAAAAPAPVVIEEVADPVVDTGKRAIRMLLIDMTASGNGTATGELKQNLFGGMRDVQTLQICAWQGALGVAEDGKGVAITADAAETLIDVFAPDIILYRPTPNTPVLHAFAMKVIRAWRDTPLAVWIMDDWPESLKISDPEQALALDTDWRQLLEWSAFRLSISQRMSDAFEARYGKTFIAIANGVDPDQWRRGGLLVRYGGGLAENMGLDSVLRLAEAVDALAEEGEDIRLEILTRKHWETSAGARFKDFKRTQIKTNLLSAEKYREWLMGADVLAICYNFDEASRAYVQHSMANKLPECLASGATLIAHGPKHIATMAQVAALDCAIVVDEPSVEDIKAQLRRVIAEPAWAKAMAAKAREIAFERFGLEQARSRFIAGVEASLAAGTVQLTPGSVRLGRVAGRLGRLARSMRRRDDGALEAKTGKPADVA